LNVSNPTFGRTCNRIWWNCAAYSNLKSFYK
jgi:hypothetical protein